MKNNKQVDIKINYEYTLDIGEEQDKISWKANKAKGKELFIANIYGNPDSAIVNKIVNKIVNSLGIDVTLTVEEYIDCRYVNYLGYQIQENMVEIRLVTVGKAQRSTFTLRECSVENILKEVLGFVGVTDYYLEVE